MGAIAGEGGSICGARRHRRDHGFRRSLIAWTVPRISGVILGSGGAILQHLPAMGRVSCAGCVFAKAPGGRATFLHEVFLWQTLLIVTILDLRNRTF
jgi:hypothetical protein